MDKGIIVLQVTEPKFKVGDIVWYIEFPHTNFATIVGAKVTALRWAKIDKEWRYKVENESLYENELWPTFDVAVYEYNQLTEY